MAELTRPALRLDGAGTPESAWQASPQLHHLRPWTKPAPSTRRCVIVAPHPDHEILGVGGIWALLASARIGVVLVAVTDGENSHPRRRGELRQRRPLESAAAAACLRVAPVQTVRLRHPDGGITEPSLRAQLAHLIRPGDLVLAPWDHDGHPDHDRVGRAARAVADRHGAGLLCYLVWAWHWAAPDGPDLPWDKALRVELDPDLTGRKRAAVRCFATQTHRSQPHLA